MQDIGIDHRSRLTAPALLTCPDTKICVNYGMGRSCADFAEFEQFPVWLGACDENPSR